MSDLYVADQSELNPLRHGALRRRFLVHAGLSLVLFAMVVALLMMLLVPIVTLHAANGLWFAFQQGGWEYPAFWAMAVAAHALLGEGVVAVRSPAAGAALA